MSIPFPLVGIAAFILIFLLVVALLQRLWNMTTPELFYLLPLRFGQALRLLLIARILFGSPGFIRFGGGMPPIRMIEQGTFSD